MQTGETLSIKNGILEYGEGVYPLKNISSVRLSEHKHSEEVNESGILRILLVWLGKALMLLGVILIVAACSPSSRDTATIGLMIVTLIALGKWLTTLENKKIYTVIFYGLDIETNAGSNALFFSKDKVFIEEIKNKLSKALSNIDDTDYSISTKGKTL